MSAETIPTNTLSQIENTITEQINSDHIEVPMLPEVAGRVVRLTQDVDSDAAELATLIQSDQTLAGHVMRVANSALYSPNNSLVSLQQAIARLGMKLISEIALAASINSSLFNTPGYEDHIQYEIRYSLMSGLWAKEVARASRRNVEAAFITGLLHDIGRPVAVQTALEAATTCGIKLDTTSVYALEEKYQRDIGVKVVEQWEMPTIVRDVVRYFDDYSAAGDAMTQTMIAIAGAEFASHSMCEQGTEGCLTRDQLVAHPVLAELNLYQDEVLDLLEKEDQVKSAMEAMRS
ncbi:HDOD domain-containing protein [Teredinibacter purpureus]|uniref:HDOD domain-containing protein n=1 Tax=Teredinibacter purpureus TaxID=2731756 RepID=UPI0005F76DFD|nr:HDOD domain-containing protein [Teredinibacter purpureus]